MARKRMLSPEMFTSENVSSWPVATRWTWAGMLCYLDDTGRGKDNSALVKAVVWPLDEKYTSRKVEADLDLFVEAQSLCRYSCCRVAQLHAPTWPEWQRISHPTPTKLCPCPRHESDAHELHRKESGRARECLPRSSGNIPPSVVEVSLDKSSSRGSCSHDSDPALCALCKRLRVAS